MSQNKIFLSQLNVLTATPTLNFPNLTANGGTASLPVTVTGATTSDFAMVLTSNASDLANGVVYDAYVSGADTVTVVATNTTGGGYTPPSQTYFVMVFKNS